jgi:putative flippase GtrA
MSYKVQMKGYLDRNKIIRFFLVSGLNTAFGYGLFAILILLGLHYAIAGFITTVCGVIFNYKTIGVLVFKNKKNTLILKFLGVYGINYVIGMLLLTFLERSGIDAFISSSLFQVVSFQIINTPRVNTCVGAAILVMPMGLFAYALNHLFVFNGPNIGLPRKKASC